MCEADVIQREAEVGRVGRRGVSLKAKDLRQQDTGLV